MRKSLLSGLLMVVVTLFAGQVKAQTNRFTIGFYNAENLFDTQDDPAINDQEYLPDSELKWDEARYKAKLTALSRVVDTLGYGVDILGMCEVENLKVLEDLAKTELLKTKAYQVIHKNSPDRRGIDVALLYKKQSFIPLGQQWLPVATAADTGFHTRDILYVKGLPIKAGKMQKDTLHILVCHFPSRRGGQNESSGKRMLAALVARKQIDLILNKDNKAKVLLMGDLNDEPIDSSILYGLKAGDRTKREWSAQLLHNTAWQLKAEKKGTHFYRGEFSMLDQIIVSKGLVNGDGLKLKGQEVIYNPHWMAQHDAKYEGAPLRTFVGKRYFGGFSDHFPVFVELTF